MKMVKKILLGTLAVAAILSFASCQREEAGNSSIIDINGASSSGSVDYTNDGDTTTRGFKTLLTQHLDAICHIEYTVTDLVQGKGQIATGTMGYIFNVVKNEDTNKYSFTIAGLRHNQENNTIEAYVETFKDVAADSLEASLTGGHPATGSGTYVDSGSSSGWGFQLVSATTLANYLNAQSTEPKKLDVWIDVVANGKATTNAENWPTNRNNDNDTEGSYTVRFFTEDPERNSSELTYNLAYNSVSPIKTVTVPVADTNAKYEQSATDKKLSNMQTDCGFYANVYAGQTLKGKWELKQIKKEAEEIEE